MQIPNLPNCLILTTNAHRMSSYTPLFIYLLVFPLLQFLTLCPLPYYLSFTLSISCFSLSLMLLISLLLRCSLSSPPYLFPPSPFLFFPPSISSLFCSLCYMHSIPILRSMTLLIPLSSSPSLLFPLTLLPYPSLPLYLSPSPHYPCLLLCTYT